MYIYLRMDLFLSMVTHTVTAHEKHHQLHSSTSTVPCQNTAIHTNSSGGFMVDPPCLAKPRIPVTTAVPAFQSYQSRHLPLSYLMIGLPDIHHFSPVSLTRVCLFSLPHSDIALKLANRTTPTPTIHTNHERKKKEEKTRRRKAQLNFSLD
jgi:hypothetical protein